MWLTLGVSVGAGVGAVCRYVVDRVIAHKHDRVFPWGTFTINVLGSFVLGITVGLGAHHGLASTAVAIIGSGFCAGFTTFSTWMWETIALAQDDARFAAVLNITASVAVGLVAAGFGLWVSG